MQNCQNQNIYYKIRKNQIDQKNQFNQYDPSKNGHKKKHSSGHRYTASHNPQQNTHKDENIKDVKNIRPNSSQKNYLQSHSPLHLGKMRPSTPVNALRVRTQIPTSIHINQQNNFNALNPISRFTSPKYPSTALNTPKNQDNQQKISIKNMNYNNYSIYNTIQNSQKIQFTQNSLLKFKKSEKLILVNPQKSALNKKQYSKRDLNLEQNKNINAKRDIQYKKQNKNEQISSSQIQKIKFELMASLHKYIDDFRYQNFQNVKNIAELEKRIQQNQKLIKQKDKKINELKSLLSQNQNLNIYKKSQQASYKNGYISIHQYDFIIDRIKDIQLRLQVQSQKILFVNKQQQNLNKTLLKVENGSLKLLSSKIQNLTTKINSFFKTKTLKLQQTQNYLETILNNFMPKFKNINQNLKLIYHKQPTSNQMFTSFGTISTLNKNSSVTTKTSHLSTYSFGKFQDFQQSYNQCQQSISSDYFCYPQKNQIIDQIKTNNVLKLDNNKNQYINNNNKSFYQLNDRLKSLQQLCDSQVENLFVDAGGHLRYKDSGIYVFDKKTCGLITLNEDQKQFIKTKGLICKKKDIPLLKKKALL